jgi:hypothetical protein
MYHMENRMTTQGEFFMRLEGFWGCWREEIVAQEIIGRMR